MEPENLNQETPQAEQPSSLHQVTPLSKYLAMALFVILPFVGGYVGYTFAPDKIVEVEKEVIREVEVERIVEVPDSKNNRFLVGVLGSDENITIYSYENQSTSTDSFVVSPKNISSWADSEDLIRNPFEDDTFLNWTAFTNLEIEKGCEMDGCVNPGVVLESRGYEIVPKFFNEVAEFEWVSATEYRYKTSFEGEWLTGTVSGISE